MLIQYANNLLRYGRIDPVEYYACPQFGVVYVENAKVACTAIKQALFPELDHAAMGQEGFHAALRGRASFTPPRGTGEFLYFSVFRDPVDRFASAFRDKIVREGPQGIFGLRSQRLIFGAFAGINPVGSTCDIASFAQAVGSIPDTLRDRHIAAQSPILRSLESASEYRILKLEELAEDWQSFQAKTGIGDLPRLNTTDDQPVLPADAELRWVSSVRQVYANDFKALDYPVPYT